MPKLEFRILVPYRYCTNNVFAFSNATFAKPHLINHRNSIGKSLQLLTLARAMFLYIASTLLISSAIYK